jgi:hypothetical protein
MHLYLVNNVNRKVGFPGGKVIILEGHSIDHSEQKLAYVNVSYSERFLRKGYFTE